MSYQVRARLVGASRIWVAVTPEALTYHDRVLLLSQIVETGLITAQQARPLTRLDERLEALAPPDSTVWTVEGLQGASEWETVRLQARDCLEQLGASGRARTPLDPL